jgi:hypothetical protein
VNALLDAAGYEAHVASEAH